MSGDSKSHVLIVAGPSGAGKSSFLRELAAGRLHPDIQSLLPEGAESWREVWCNRPQDWEPWLASREPGGKPGIAVHYDMTLKWRTLARPFESDPFWQVLDRCTAATLINIRPTPERLLLQWMHRHLGVRSTWAAHCKRAITAIYRRLLCDLRRLRRPPRRGNRRWHYPRRIRFLERLDRALHARQSKPTPNFDLYRRPGVVERMLGSWDATTARTLAGIPVTRIDLTPDDDAEIAKSHRWRILSVLRAGAQ